MPAYKKKFDKHYETLKKL